jgi:hypothetical protein
MSTLRRRLVAVGATAIASTLVIAGCAATEEETTAVKPTHHGLRRLRGHRGGDLHHHH